MVVAGILFLVCPTIWVVFIGSISSSIPYCRRFWQSSTAISVRIISKITNKLIEFDILIVALLNKEEACDVIEQLKQHGVDEKIIIWKKPHMNI